MIKRSLALVSLVFLVLLFSGCKAKKFTVEFDLNGGAGTVLKQEVKKNKTVIKPADPTREGYNFVSWTLDGKEWNFAEDKVDKNITLKAAWDAIITVKFDTDGGKPLVDSVIVEPGAKINEPAIVPYKEGYVFLGWGLDGDLFDFDKTLIDANLTIVALWEEMFEVTFDTDGGRPLVDSVIVEPGAKINEPARIPYKEGYVFLGWGLDGDLFDFDKTVIDSSLTIVALWEKMFEVTFDVSGGDEEIEPILVEPAKKVSKPTEPTREGYKFLGWYLNEELFDFDTAVNEDITLVAQWEKDEPVTEQVNVYFNADGGEPESFALGLEKGELVDEPAEPVKEGYEFLGWYLNDELFDFDTPVNEDITLIAKWEEIIVRIKISFSLNGGTPDVPRRLVVKGETINIPKEPSKDGFVFRGWHLNDELFDFDTPINEDITLVAVWDEEITVTFDSNDGEPEYDAVIIGKNGTVTKPADPTKDGYLFKGWYLNEELFDFDAPISEDITLVAEWDEAITVTFDSNGGEPEYDPVIIVKKGKVAKPADPTKEGSKFIGWYFQDIPFNFNASIHVDITLTAKWELIEYDVTFDADGGTPSVQTIPVKHGKKAIKPADPTKEDHEFLYWYLDDSEEEYDFNEPITEDLYLIALWREIEYITVSYYWEEDEDSSIDLKIEKGTIPEYLEVFTKENYELVGYAISGVLYNFDEPLYENTYLEPVWEMIVQAYVNGVAYASAFDAVDDLEENQTVYLTDRYDGEGLSIHVDNVTITKYGSSSPVVKAPIFVSSNNVTISDLRFTDDARIVFEGSIAGFNFTDNHVYDLNLEDDNDFNRERRANVSAFIYGYNASKYKLEKINIRRNKFENINATAILLAMQTVEGTINVNDNYFNEIKHSALRIDADYFDGTLNIKNNYFLRTRNNAIFINSFGSEINDRPVQSMYIENNYFKHVSNNNYEQSVNDTGSAAIIINENSHEKVVNVYATNNEFYNTYNAFYIDNIYGDNKPTFSINDNIFEDSKGKYLYQRFEANEIDKANVDFTNNAFLNSLGRSVGNKSDTSQITQRLTNNNNFRPFYVDDSLIFENEYSRSNYVTIYVNSTLNMSQGDEVQKLGKTFVYGVSAFNSLQEAVNKANSGSGVIYVDSEGTYKEDIVVNTAHIYIIGANAGVAYNDDEFTSDTAVIEGKITIRRSGVVIDGLKFAGNSRVDFSPIVEQIVGFKFLNNTIQEYTGDKDFERGFIELIALTDNQSYKDIYLIGNTFDEMNELIPFIGDNVENLYIINNYISTGAFVKKGIVLRGTNGGYTGTGATGNVYVYRNRFYNFSYEQVLLDYYNDLNLKIMYNYFANPYRALLKLNKTDVDSGIQSRVVFSNNTVYGGDKSRTAYVEIVEATKHNSKLRVMSNHFLHEPLYYVKNTGEISGTLVTGNKYDGDVTLDHFVNISSFTTAETLPEYEGIVE